MATVVKFSRTAARSALALADWMAIEYADHGRVDWEQSCNLRLSSNEKRALSTGLLPWLRRNFDVQQGLVTWAANPSTTAQEVQAKLKLFGHTAHASLAVATIVRQTAALLRTQGWRQGNPQPGQLGGPLDIVGAIVVVCNRDNFGVQLKIAAIDTVRAHLNYALGYTDSVSDWNDEPSRTKQDVLHMLSTCADDTETI